MESNSHHFFSFPGNLSVTEFPASAGAAKNEVINARKPMIKDLLNMLRGQVSGKDFGKWLADDVEFEDIWTTWTGKEMLSVAVDLTNRHVEDMVYTIQAEKHGVHEVLLELNMTFKSKYLPDISYPSR